MDYDRKDNTSTTYACRRGGERYRLLYANEAFVEFVGSDGRPWKLDLMGISADGLCFGLQDGKPSLERGSRLDSIVVQIASIRINGMLTIAHATEEFAAGTICGAKFQPATDADQLKLKEAIAKLGW